MYTAVKYQPQGATAVIWLNRPDNLNTWTYQMEQELKHAIGQAEDDPNIVGIVITGEGKAFCAGADMAELQSLSDGSGGQRKADPALKAQPGDPVSLKQYHTDFAYLASVRKPIIAAVNGAVAGMALPFILFCDLRFFGKSGFVISSFAKMGLVAEYGTSWILPRIVGIDKALDIMWSNRKIYGDEAHALGLATRVYEDEDLLSSAVDYIETLAQHCAPDSLRQIKGQLYRDLQRSAEEAIKDANDLMLTSFGGDDLKEGIGAFMEKRPPQFKPVGKG